MAGEVFRGGCEPYWLWIVAKRYICNSAATDTIIYGASMKITQSQHRLRIVDSTYLLGAAILQWRLSAR